MKIYIDGKYYDKDEAKISVFDHGLLYGDGVFEGIRIYNNKIFKLKEHIKRLFASARALKLNIGMTEQELEKTIQDCVTKNDPSKTYIRLLVTRGKGNLGINPRRCEKTSIIIIVDDIQIYPKHDYIKGIKIITASTRRLTPQCFDAQVKSLNYLNNIMAKIEANNAGCPEALMLNTEGYVAECTGDNIFIVKNGVLITPEHGSGALDGITKQHTIQLAENIGIPVKEQKLTQYDIYTADECFLTGTAAEVIPVIELDGRRIAEGHPGEISKKLIQNFQKSIA